MLKTGFFGCISPSLVSILLLSGGLQYSTAKGVQIQGRVNASMYRSTGEEQTQLPAADFECFVDENLWKIAVFHTSNHYTLAGCDGTNSATILFDPGQSNTFPRPAWITPGLCPLDNSWYTSLPWLAFASGPYLKDQTNSELPGLWGSPRSDIDTWLFRKSITKLGHTPFLPADIKFHVDPKIRQSLLADPFQNQHVLSTRHPEEFRTAIAVYPPSFLGGHYQVQSTTNIGDVQIPLGFTLERYHPKYDNKGKLLGSGLIVKFWGNVTNCTTVSGFEPMPVPDRTLGVTDYRFAKKSVGADYINYRVTNTLVLPIESTYLQSVWSDKLKRANENLSFLLKARSRPRPGTVPPGPAQIFTKWLFILIVLLPLLVAGWRKRRSNRSTKETT